MNAEAIEHAILTWEREHHFPVSKEIRRKIVEGYMPTTERACRMILDTIRQATLEKSAPTS